MGIGSEEASPSGDPRPKEKFYQKQKMKEAKQEKNSEEIRIPVIQITMEGKRTVLDEAGNVVEQVQELRETEWLTTTIPPKPLRVEESIGANGLTSQAKASVGKKKRRRKRKI